MIANARAGMMKLKDTLWVNRNRIYSTAVIGGVVLTILLMYYRAFFGTELSDEAFYVAEAKEMLNGNIPFSYGFSLKVVGFSFLLVPLIALYGLFVPGLSGVFLFTRLCFVTYKVFVWAVVYSVLKRRLKNSHALLISALMIPLNGPILNFSYNTIPELTFFMAGCLLYDVIEQDVPRKRERLLLTGFFTGIACFANPGWSVALIIFAALIAVRVKDQKTRIQYFLYFGGSVLAEVLIVVVPVCIRTGFKAFCYGFYRLFINPMSLHPLESDKSWRTVLDSFSDASDQWITVFVVIFLLIYGVLWDQGRNSRTAVSKRQYVQLAIISAFFVHSLYIIKTYHMNLSSSNGGEIRAFATFCYMVLFICAGLYKKDKIVWYLGSYQATYAIAAILLVSVDATIYRFVNVYTVIVPVLYIMIKNRSAVVRMMSVVLAVAVVGSLGYANFKRIFRDGYIHNLTARVQSGVYKGLYTTPDRAKDLPEMEEYLNGVIGEGETYSFRDNVPFAYLMTHQGRVCEIQTWDSLQYFYDRNSPQLLYDYYRVRDMIPDKIIYIKSNVERDSNLSIQDTGWKYNEWVNTYYDLVEQVEFNDTFPLVLVYQYNGTFDGDYQRWIDKALE